MKTVEMKKCNFVLEIPTWESVKKADDITVENMLVYTDFICNEDEIIIQYQQEEYILTREYWERYMAGYPRYCCFKPKNQRSSFYLKLTGLYWAKCENGDEDGEVFWDNETLAME
jgi:hypothetical protein